MAVKRGLGKGLDSMIPMRRGPQDESLPKDSINDTSTDQKKEEVPPEGNEGMRVVPMMNASLGDIGQVPLPEVGKKQEEMNLSGGLNSETNQVCMVKITQVEPNQAQARRNFDEESLEELAGSIQQYGILQPILVTKQEHYYEIIAGERRWRAAKLAGLTEVPIIIKEMSEIEKAEVSLTENIQREDLNPIEEAKAYQQLIEEFHLKQDELAQRVSKNRSTITNSMRLLKLDDKVQQMLIDEMISAGHARALLALEDKETQRTVAMRIFDDKLSVRETEKLIKKLTEEPKQNTTTSKTKDLTMEAIYEKMEEKIKRILGGSKVQIQRKRNNKGKIEIEYYSQEDLERIIDLFESIDVSQ